MNYLKTFCMDFYWKQLMKHHRQPSQLFSDFLPISSKGQIWSKFYPLHLPTLDFLLIDICQENELISKTYVIMLWFREKFGKTLKHYSFRTLFRQKQGKHARVMPRIKFNFFPGNYKRRSRFHELFILAKYHKFWLSYEWFSVLGDILLPKRSISSSSCMQEKWTHLFQTILGTREIWRKLVLSSLIFLELSSLILISWHYVLYIWDWIKQFGIANYKSFFISYESNTILLQLFHES